jgi:hypothetical protein
MDNAYKGFHPPSSNWTPDRIDPNSTTPEDFFSTYIATRTPVVLTSFPKEFAESKLSWDVVVKLAGYAEVKVERRDAKTNQFGSGEAREVMTISELDGVLEQGQHYLTTQYIEDSHEDDDDDEDQYDLYGKRAFWPEPLHAIEMSPSRPRLLCRLAPHQDDDGDDVDEEELSRLSAYCQPPLCEIVDKFPHRPKLLGRLAPHQVRART